MFVARDQITEGSDIINYPTMPVNPCNCNFESLSDVENEWESFDSSLGDQLLT